jgi:hypothetical protein
MRSAAEERDQDDGHDVGRDRDPQVERGAHPDAVTLLCGERRAEHDDGRSDDVHQRHADGPQDVPAVLAEDLRDRRLRDGLVRRLLLERRRLVDATPDDVARDDHDGAQVEGDPPAPGGKGVLGQPRRQRQEHRCGDDGCGLRTLQGEAGIVAAAPERCVLHDHGAGATQFTGHREPLDDAQEQQQDRGPDPNLRVGREQPDGEGREPHHQHAQDQDVLAAVPVPPVTQDRRPDRPGKVADGVRDQGRHERDGRVALREEDGGEHQRRGLGVDREVVVLQDAADPAAGGRLLR